MTHKNSLPFLSSWARSAAAMTLAVLLGFLLSQGQYEAHEGEADPETPKPEEAEPELQWLEAFPGGAPTFHLLFTGAVEGELEPCG